MWYGVLIVSSVGRIEATFSSCDTPIGEGSTPVVVEGAIGSSLLGFVVFPNRFIGQLGDGLDMLV